MPKPTCPNPQHGTGHEAATHSTHLSHPSGFIHPFSIPNPSDVRLQSHKTASEEEQSGGFFPEGRVWEERERGFSSVLWP